MNSFKNAFDEVMKEIITHKSTYKNKWGSANLGVSSQQSISTDFLKYQEDILRNANYQKTRSYGEFDLVSIKDRLFTRAVPRDIGFSWNGISLKIKIKIEDHEKQRILAAGEEIITNLENDIDESNDIINFYKNLVIADDGYVELGDSLHLVYTDDYSKIEDIIEQIQERINIYEDEEDEDYEDEEDEDEEDYEEEEEEEDECEEDECEEDECEDN